MKMKVYLSAGPHTGILIFIILVIGYFLMKVLEIFDPAKNIKKAINFPSKQYIE